MSDWVPGCDPGHRGSESIAQTGSTSDSDGPFASLVEKIMTFTVRELRDDELQKVSGGLKADSNEVAVEGFVSGALGVAGGGGAGAVTAGWDLAKNHTF